MTLRRSQKEPRRVNIVVHQVALRLCLFLQFCIEQVQALCRQRPRHVGFVTTTNPLETLEKTVHLTSAAHVRSVFISGFSYSYSISTFASPHYLFLFMHPFY